MSSSVTILAPAKINLSLQVIGKLPNGYHELDSWMLKLDLADELCITMGDRPGIHLQCLGSNLPCGPENLLWQAAEKFYQRTQLPAAITIVLHKNIPVAAGLGGGSSDAAALLNFLNREHDFILSQGELNQLALSIGADLPFFISNWVSARSRGIGEELTPLFPLKNCFFLLVNPGFRVSTAWVFANFRPPFSLTAVLADISKKSTQPTNYALTRGGKTTILGRAVYGMTSAVSLQNDLERVTIANYPEIFAIKDFLLEHGAQYAAMSGSGPTVFAVFSGLTEVEKVASLLPSNFPGSKAIITSTLKQ